MSKRKREYRSNPLKLIGMIAEGLNNNFIDVSLIKMSYEEPLTNIYIKYDELVITIEVLGVKKEDIKVYVTKRMIRVRANNRFYKNIRLPFKIDPNNAKVTYNNGILEIKAGVLKTG
ncbi:MAG: Hsp20/alpha crystallin family protein [Thermoprotei archaeon]